MLSGYLLFTDYGIQEYKDCSDVIETNLLKRYKYFFISSDGGMVEAYDKNHKLIELYGYLGDRCFKSYDVIDDIIISLDQLAKDYE